MPIKIAMIGAGSIGFTRKLMHDILAVPELADTHFAFMDINAGNLEMVMQLAQRDIDANGLPATITPTTDQRKAIADADYVISVVRQGGLDAFQLDIDIPLKYGIDQCVGDTICAGGIMYGQRTIPALLNICAGINHQTWYTQVEWRGMDMAPRMLELFEGHSEYTTTEKLRIDMIRRFGYYTTESNGHVSEYVPWYRKRPDEINDWIDLSRWINGETGGYLRVCTEGRNWFETDFPNWMKQEPPTITPERRSEEHGSYIIEGLETGRTYRGHFNIINQGHITNLPDGCCIEIPGYVDKNGMNMPVVGDLPLACAATCAASVQVQRMAVEAAVHGDVMLLKQAMLHDPLTAAVCNPEEIWQMTDEMLVAQARWLPQYREQIPAAQARLQEAERNNTRVGLREGWKGAARLHTKSVAEMAQDKAAATINAAAADKGELTKEPA